MTSKCRLETKENLIMHCCFKWWWWWWWWWWWSSSLCGK